MIILSHEYYTVKDIEEVTVIIIKYLSNTTNIFLFKDKNTYISM
jgi:hypothetical protein